MIDAQGSLSGSPPGTLDETIIAELLQLDRTVRPGVLRKLVQTFIDTSAGLLDRIASNQGAAAAAHSLKGASASIGAVCLVALVVELQGAMSRGAADSALSRLLEAVRGERDLVCRALSKVAGMTLPH